MHQVSGAGEKVVALLGSAEQVQHILEGLGYGVKPEFFPFQREDQAQWKKSDACEADAPAWWWDQDNANRAAIHRGQLHSSGQWDRCQWEIPSSCELFRLDCQGRQEEGETGKQVEEEANRDEAAAADPFQHKEEEVGERAEASAAVVHHDCKSVPMLWHGGSQEGRLRVQGQHMSPLRPERTSGQNLLPSPGGSGDRRSSSGSRSRRMDERRCCSTGGLGSFHPSVERREVRGRSPSPCGGRVSMGRISSRQQGELGTVTKQASRHICLGPSIGKQGELGTVTKQAPGHSSQGSGEAEGSTGVSDASSWGCEVQESPKSSCGEERTGEEGGIEAEKEKEEAPLQEGQEAEGTLSLFGSKPYHLSWAAASSEEDVNGTANGNRCLPREGGEARGPAAAPIAAGGGKKMRRKRGKAGPVCQQPAPKSCTTDASLLPRPPEEVHRGSSKASIEELRASSVAGHLPRPPEEVGSGSAPNGQARAESENSEQAAIDALVEAARSWTPEWRAEMVEFLVPQLTGKPLEALLRVDQELKAAAR